MKDNQVMDALVVANNTIFIRNPQTNVPYRYNNIELLLAKPAYQSRNSKFIVQMPGGRKEVLREESENSQQAADSQGGSLFD